jgi:hypothetical protein
MHLRSFRLTSLPGSFVQLPTKTFHSIVSALADKRKLKLLSPLRRRTHRQAVCVVLILSLLLLPGSGLAYAEVPKLGSELAAGLVKLSTLPFIPVSTFLKRLFGKSGKVDRKLLKQELTA